MDVSQPFTFSKDRKIPCAVHLYLHSTSVREYSIKQNLHEFFGVEVSLEEIGLIPL
jgi:hypothetical protein